MSDSNNNNPDQNPNPDQPKDQNPQSTSNDAGTPEEVSKPTIPDTVGQLEAQPEPTEPEETLAAKPKEFQPEPEPVPTEENVTPAPEAVPAETPTPETAPEKTTPPVEKPAPITPEPVPTEIPTETPEETPQLQTEFQDSSEQDSLSVQTPVETDQPVPNEVLPVVDAPPAVTSVENEIISEAKLATPENSTTTEFEEMAKENVGTPPNDIAQFPVTPEKDFSFTPQETPEQTKEIITEPTFTGEPTPETPTNDLAGPAEKLTSPPADFEPELVPSETPKPENIREDIKISEREHYEQIIREQKNTIAQLREKCFKLAEENKTLNDAKENK